MIAGDAHGSADGDPQAATASGQGDPADRAAGGTRWWNPRILRALVVVLFGLGCLAAGAAVGWWVRDQRGEALAPLQIDAVVDRPVVLAAPPGAALGQMPSILGLTIGQAKRVLFDVGVPAEAITVSRRPSALDSGIVLRQEPPTGSPVSDAVELVVSAESVVPDLVGLPVDEARHLLEDLGVQVTIQGAPGGGAAPGLVVGSIPPARERLVRSMVLEVATR